MKKIKLTESDLYRIIKQVLLEQDEEEKSFTFSPGAFKSLITSSSSEKFVKHLNNNFDEIIINGGLYLIDTQIKSLPNNLHVVGSLWLEGTQIQSLPDNLDVKGTIYIYGTPLNDNDKLVAKYREKYTINRD